MRTWVAPMRTWVAPMRTWVAPMRTWLAPKRTWVASMHTPVAPIQAALMCATVAPMCKWATPKRARVALSHARVAPIRARIATEHARVAPTRTRVAPTRTRIAPMRTWVAPMRTWPHRIRGGRAMKYYAITRAGAGMGRPAPRARIVEPQGHPDGRAIEGVYHGEFKQVQGCVSKVSGAEAKGCSTYPDAAAHVRRMIVHRDNPADAATWLFDEDIGNDIPMKLYTGPGVDHVVNDEAEANPHNPGDEETARKRRRADAGASESGASMRPTGGSGSGAPMRSLFAPAAAAAPARHGTPPSRPTQEKSLTLTPKTTRSLAQQLHRHLEASAAAATFPKFPMLARLAAVCAEPSVKPVPKGPAMLGESRAQLHPVVMNNVDGNTNVDYRWKEVVFE
eukprot:gene25888-34854_t